MGPRHGDDEVSTSEVVPAVLVEALLRLCQGEFSHRLPRTMARDEPDTIAFFFNAIAEELAPAVVAVHWLTPFAETLHTAMSNSVPAAR